MAKYIDTEKLNSLIDNKLEDLGMSGSVWVGRSVLCELKDEIKSLQQEQPEEPIPKDLEEAARLYAIPHYMRNVDVNYFEEYPYDKIAEAAFIAGAKWQSQQHRPVSGKYTEMDFESTRNTFSEDVYNHNRKNKTPIDMIDLDDAFETGADWMEKQMMKEAIPCKVFWHDGPLLDYTQEQQDNALERIGANVGDKVRILIVKDD